MASGGDVVAAMPLRPPLSVYDINRAHPVGSGSEPDSSMASAEEEEEVELSSGGKGGVDTNGVPLEVVSLAPGRSGSRGGQQPASVSRRNSMTGGARTGIPTGRSGSAAPARAAAKASGGKEGGEAGAPPLLKQGRSVGAALWARARAKVGFGGGAGSAAVGMSLTSMANRWKATSQERMERRKRVLEKAPAERDIEDLYMLEELLLRVKSISKLPIEKRLEVCRVMTYEKVLPNTAVCRQGEFGSTFYIVLSGTLRVTVTNELSGDEVNVTNLFAGDSFGELALMVGSNRRSATVTTHDTCQLLKVDKKDYDFILKRVKAEELNETVSFLKDIPIFHKTSRSSLHRLAYVLRSRTFAPGSVIARQGTEAEEMFFVKSGECRVLMTMDVPQGFALGEAPKSGQRRRVRAGAPARHSTGTHGTGPNTRRGSARGSAGGGGSGRLPQVRHSDPGYDGGEGSGLEGVATGDSVEAGGTAGGSASSERVFVEVGWLRQRDFFGEIGVVRKSMRRASVVACTTVEVLVLSRWDFNRRIDGEAMSAIHRSVQSYTSTDNLRKQFVETCRWEAYKKDLVDSIIATKNKRKDGNSR